MGVLVALAIAVLRGGSLQALGSVRLQWVGLAVAMFAIQALFIYRPSYVKNIGAWRWTEVLFLATHTVLLAVVWANRQHPGMKCIAAGLLLNTAAMAANGGWMPVTARAVTEVGYADLVPELTSGLRFPNSKNIVLAAAETRLSFLTDVLVLPRPFPIPSVFSIGDILVALGSFGFVQSATLGKAGIRDY
jgi:hypothetical protein